MEEHVSKLQDKTHENSSAIKSSKHTEEPKEQKAFSVSGTGTFEYGWHAWGCYILCLSAFVVQQPVLKFIPAVCHVWKWQVAP